MGKWLICAQHACNDWAASFSNALVYRTPDEFVAHLAHALAAEPPPLSDEELRCAAPWLCCVVIYAFKGTSSISLRMGNFMRYCAANVLEKLALCPR